MNRENIEKIVEKTNEWFRPSTPESEFIRTHENIMRALHNLTEDNSMGNRGMTTIIEHISEMVVNTGTKISAIKLVRAITNAGLKDAKDFVEALQELNAEDTENTSVYPDANFIGDVLREINANI